MQNFSQINSVDFKYKLESGDYTLLDVRTANEHVLYGIIDRNQLHIDIHNPEAISRIKKLPKEKKYLVYCFHGHRSQYVVQIMQELCFCEVYDLEGGIDVWNKK